MFETFEFFQRGLVHGFGKNWQFIYPFILEKKGHKNEFSAILEKKRPSSL